MKGQKLTDGSAFCDKNVQISSLYNCSFTIFCSFLCQLLTCLITNKKHMFFCVKQDKGYCVLNNAIDWLIGYFNFCKHILIDSQESSIALDLFILYLLTPTQFRFSGGLPVLMVEEDPRFIFGIIYVYVGIQVGWLIHVLSWDLNTQ